jgi:exosome complex component RRP4
LSYIIDKREFVTPGELLAEGDYNAGKNTYREESKIYASRLGLANHVGKNVYVVALNGVYMPAPGDLVIGKVVDMRLNGWIVDINAPSTAMLFTSDAMGRSFNARRDEMSDFLDVGDLILAKIFVADRTRDPVLSIRESGLGKITQGHIIRIMPAKIPRVIGKKGSMINIVKRETDCHITISQNGLILISGRKPEQEALAIQAIHMIEKDAHTTGLTDRVGEFLVKEKEKMVSSIERKE